jgi:hypothetical protein
MQQHGEVVISAVGHGRPEELDGQLKIVQAIKEAGCVKVTTLLNAILPPFQNISLFRMQN